MLNLFKQQSQYSSRRWIQILIVSGALLLSFVIGLFTEINYLIILFLLTAAIGVFIISVRYPSLGLLVLIACALFVDIEIRTGTNTKINIVIILLPIYIGIWLLDMFVRRQNIYFTPSRTNPPLVALAVISLLAFGIGQITWFLYARHAPILSQLGGLAIFILSVGAFILTANVIENLIWLKRLSWLFIIVGTFILVLRLIPYFGPFVNNLLPDGNSGSLFWVWLIAISFSQFLINRDLHQGSRFLLLSLIIIAFYMAFFQGFDWKSGWVPPLAAIGMISWIRFQRLRIILAIGAVFAIYLISADLIQSDQYSYITRIEAWEIMFNEIVNVNPLLGLGPANYRFYTPLFPIMGYNVEFNSHNNYIDMLAQIGLLGLIAFLWFAWEVFRLGWGLLKQELDSFSQAYIVGALGGLVGMLVAGMLGDWILPFVYNVGMRGFRSSVLGWIFLGGLVVIGRIAMTEKNQSQQE